MPINLKVENENELLTKYLITEKDDQGEDVPAIFQEMKLEQKLERL